MPSYSPPLKNVSYVFYVSLVSQSNTKIFQANPTLTAGDVKVAIDDGAPANLLTLPVVDADFTKRVKVALAAAEMNGDNITIVFADAAGAEWCDLTVNLQTVTNQFDSLATQTSVNTIDDFLDTEVAAIKAKTDNLPSDPADASDIAALIDALPTAAEVWTATTRTLTSTAAAVAAAVSGSNLTITRAVTFSATITGLTISASWSKIYFSVAKNAGQLDVDAMVQIIVSNPAAPLTDGLVRVNKVAGTLAQGSLVVNQALGTVAITIADNSTTLLVIGSYVYDIKALLSDGTSVLLTAAGATISDTVTQTI